MINPVHLLTKINPIHLETLPELKRLLPIDPIRFAELVEKMRGGYNEEEPIVVWKCPEGLYVVDGHTRLAAALKAALTEVTIAIKNFKDLQEAIDYAYSRQKRRHTGNLEILHVLIHSTLCQWGGDRGVSSGKVPGGTLQTNGSYPLRTQANIARLLGVGERSVARAKEYLDLHVSHQQIEAIREGKMSVHNLPEIKEKSASKSNPRSVNPNVKKRVPKASKEKTKISSYPEPQDFFDEIDSEILMELAKGNTCSQEVAIFWLAKERLEELYKAGNIVIPNYRFGE